MLLEPATILGVESAPNGEVSDKIRIRVLGRVLVALGLPGATYTYLFKNLGQQSSKLAKAVSQDESRPR